MAVTARRKLYHLLDKRSNYFCIGTLLQFRTPWAGLSGLVKGYFDSGTSTQYTHYGPGRGASGGGTHGGLTNDSSGFGSQTDYANFEFRNIPASGGTGSGATFDVSYTNGTLEFCHVNNPGSGYTNGDTLTISASNLLGTSNGSANITITANVDSTTYGSSSTFFKSKELLLIYIPGQF